MLHHPDWMPSVRDRLNTLLTTEITPGDYVVFDWDNTSVFGDIQDAVSLELIQGVGLKIPPHELYDVLDEDVLTETKNPDAHGDLVQLCHAYQTLATSEALDPQKRERAQKDFSFAFFALQEWIDCHFGHDFAVVWVLRLLWGFAPADIPALVARALGRQRDLEPGHLVLTHGQDGREVSVAVGLRLLEPMRELYAACQAAGARVYVCTASSSAVVAALATSLYGLASEADVLGMDVGLGAQGRYDGKLAKGSVPTQGGGKHARITKELVPRHGGRGPKLVAGDSNGDVAMLTGFGDTACSLVIKRPGQQGAVLTCLEQADGVRTIVQHRDEGRGGFTPVPERT